VPSDVVARRLAEGAKPAPSPEPDAGEAPAPDTIDDTDLARD